MASPVRVLVDTREEDLWEALRPWWSQNSEGWIAERQTLDVGDVVFVVGSDENRREAVILERKTAEDLGASQRDGRYREQRARLLARRGAGTHVGYLVEAPMPWSPTMSRTWCRGAFSEVGLATAIMRLQLRYGIAVFQTSGLKESVMWVRRIAAALVADGGVFDTGLAADAAGAAAAYTEAIHVKKSANMDSERLLGTMLRTIPGVGAGAAEAIVGHAADFPTFYSLTEAQIAAIPMGAGGKRKLGKAVAAKLWQAFHKGTTFPSDPSSVTGFSSHTSTSAAGVDAVSAEEEAEVLMDSKHVLTAS
jgi:ERCC4-type nuclease